MQSLILTLAPSRSCLHTASSPLSSPRLHVLLLFRSPFSSYASPPSTESERQKNSCDQESKAIKVSVLWDYENCALPAGVNAYRVANRIISALRLSGIRGPVSINAFGDMCRIPRAIQEALISTGICLTHAPHSGKNSADRLLMADVISWTTHNPPPAHFFLISSDSDFATILHRLRMNNYNVLLSCCDFNSKVSLYSAATLMWPWIALAKGKNLTPQKFNHPPDGMYGSWYGHQKDLLDDPLETFDEELMERVAGINTSVIPRSVVSGIRQVLQSHPDGMPLSVLRSELKRRKILNSGLGFKNFSGLINSLGDSLTLVPPPNGKNEPYVVLKRKRPAKLVNELDEPPCVEESAELAEQAEPEQVAMEPDESVKQSEGSETIHVIKPPSEPVKPVNPSLELDSKKMDQVDDFNKGIFGIFRKVFRSRNNSEEAIPVVKCEDFSASLPASVPVAKDKLAVNNRKDESICVDDRGLFRRIGKWFGFGREKGSSNSFADPKFWNDVEAFLTSPKGSDLVAKSRTREELMKGLQLAGMLSLKSLEDAHFIQLIELLISEKKWIQENTSSTFPFTLSILSASTSSTVGPEILPENITDPDELSIKKFPSKEQILLDCWTLVKEMLDEQPEGFDMGIFKPKFEGKFGYMLDYRKMGYPKLVSLLQTIPGIQIDLLKNKVCKSDKKEKKIEADSMREVLTNSSEEDSVFDELGPVSNEADADYHEPSLSDEEFSDEETETSAYLDRETTNERSSLIKILDTFAITKDKGAARKEPLGLDGIVDCSKRYDNNKSELWSGDNIRNTRSLRSQKAPYKFVADEDEDDKEKIVESILGTLKKNGDSSAMVEGKGI